MGIKDLRKFLKDKDVNCFFQTSLIHFSHLRVGIDGLNWLFTYLNIVYKNLIDRKKDVLEDIDQEEVFQRLVHEYLRFNNRLMNYKITPVWIWDGVSKDNKLLTKVERRSARKQMIEKKETLKKELLDMNVLERPSELLNTYKKMASTTAYLKPGKIEGLKEISKLCGIPTIIAEDEAENLASSLAVERILAAVWSSDTDTYPLGAPLVIKNFEKKNGYDYVSGIYTSKILSELDMTHKQFRDFCILLGTDFNDRIDRIGPSKAFTLIKTYGDLETITEETRHNTYGLKFNQVREQLTPYDTYYDEEIFQINKNIDEEELRSKIESDQLNLFLSNIKIMPRSRNVPKKN